MIGYNGGKAFADILKQNYVLSSLDIAGNDIPDEVVAKIGNTELE